MTVGELNETRSEHVVAREHELARLNTYLDLALSGKGQICFVTGEAGAGKSALVAEFARRAQALHDDLLLAVGLCDPQAEGRLPYAPFRDVLAILTGVADDRSAPPATKPASNRLGHILVHSAQVMVEFGPDLIGTLIPGTLLIAKFGKAVAQKGGWLDKLERRILGKEHQAKPPSAEGLTQEQLIEQYVNVIRALTQKAPLLIVLEDLHWADGASVDLLFRLVRRVEDCRILIIGTYRVHEAQHTNGSEPRQLEKVLGEIKRYRGDVWLDLNQARDERGREFVNALLDSEPNRLDESFRNNLFLHTGGHPLFTVELLRDFQNRGILVRDEDGTWMLRGAVQWDSIPARVEGVVASRIASLPSNVRADLEVASVEGVQFTAEVIARAQSEDIRSLIRELSGDLRRMQQLVEGDEVRRIGQQRLSCYHFTHRLFQRYLYNNLDAVELAFMHESVGLALEALYGDQAGEIAAQLARHFEIADLPEKARTYLIKASDQAAAGYANDAALEFLNRALKLSSLDDIEARCDILMRRERIHDLLGDRAQQHEDLAELVRLADAMPGAMHLRAEIALRHAKLALNVSDYEAAITSTQAAMQLIEMEPDATDLHVEGHLLWARALLLRGDSPQSKQQLDQAIAASREYHDVADECRALASLGGWYYAEGDYSNANQALEQALQLAHAAGDLRREGDVLNNLGLVANDQHRFSEAITYYEQAQKIAQQVGDRAFEAALLANEGLVGLETGDFVRARANSEQAAALAAEYGDRMVQGIALINHAEAHRELGEYTQASADAVQALDLLRAIHYRWGEAIVLANTGRVALSLGHCEQALQNGEDAVTIAREIGSRHTQGEALLLMGGALTELGRLPEAEKAYTEAIAIWQELGDEIHTTQSQVGLASVLVARGGQENQDAALAQIEDVVDALLRATSDEREKAGMVPIWIYLVCTTVLQAKQDPRARQLIAKAAAELQSRAARIPDPASRFSYLENVPEHRAIQHLYAPLAGAGQL